MDSPETVQFALMVVAALCGGAIIYVLVMPYLSGERQAEKRIHGVTENKALRTQRRAQVDIANNRRKQVADTIKEIEERQKAKEKLTLRMRLEQAGLDITPGSFWIASAISGLVAGGASFIFSSSSPIYLHLGLATIFGLGAPRWILKFLTNRRQSKFLAEFANCIDIIVRGVKSGLPLNECLSIIAREAPSPVREEFQELTEQQRVGMTLSDCFDRMIKRIPLAEVKFFAIVIVIQQQAGGNLSEALGNLSGVLRDRKRMQMKVKALSAEAKASAAVLGSLPFAVMIMIYLSTPSYIAILWTTQWGQVLLLAGAVWMTFGLLVMRKMINFKF